MTTGPHYVRWTVADRDASTANAHRLQRRAMRDELGHVPFDSPVWDALGPPGRVLPGSQQRCVLPAPRRCIVCGAQVPAGRSEACPHE